MIGSKLELRTPDEAEAVYYEAFMHCDKAVMAALWADGEVVCIHPGSGAIMGHEQVMRSWTHIFSDARPPKIEFSVANKSQSGELAVHLVMETISSDGQAPAIILATNVYQKFESGWLMVEHHASLVPQRRGENTLQ